MRLLPKQQVRELVAARNKAQIDEGVKIAQKVDALRQTLADLEAQHERYVAAAHAELQKEIEAELNKLAAIKVEVQRAEERRVELQKPLDEEWGKVLAGQKANEELGLRLQERIARLEERELIQDRRDGRSKEVMAQTNARDRASIKEGERLEVLKEETERLNTEARSKKTLGETIFEKREKDLNAREESIAAYEVTLQLRRDKIEFDEQEIISEKARLADQRATLERAFARLKK